MKIKTLLFLSALYSVGTYAQSLEQRTVIQQNVNHTELEKIENKFYSNYERDELAVFQYLLDHPSETRSFTKDGSLYFIKSIDEKGNPVYVNTKSNIGSGQLIKADALYNGGAIGANITGTGMVVGIWDGGQVRATHELLSGKVTMQASQTVQTTDGDNHMTHVTGTIVGKDISNTARGIAYGATSKNYDWDNDLTEMTAFASDGYLISNHSYGLGNGTDQAKWTFGAYNETAKNWDALLKTTPNYLPFVAAGNEQKENGSGKVGADQGYDVITGSSASKNVITVGAVNADRTMSDYSNFGPTDDGRVKPDICARGTGINSSQATSDTAYSGDGTDSSGTSYASPAAAASGLLLQQYYFSLNGSYLTSSMLKALMLHSADDEGTAGPDMKFGWGILNIEKAAQIIKNAKNNTTARLYTFTTNPTNDGTSQLSITGSGTTGLTPGSGTTEIKASICWTDDEGTEQVETDGIDPTTSRLVYNFDFELTRQTPLKQSFPYNAFTMATRTNTATLSTIWFGNNVDNFKQTYIPSGGTNGSDYTLALRKSASSPALTRKVAVVITGLASATTLANPDFEENGTIVFYSAIDQKIKLISNNSSSFGDYQIYDATAKVVAQGKSLSNEIIFDTNTKGLYFIKFINQGKTVNIKFLK